MNVRFASRGDPSLLVWCIAREFSSTSSDQQAFCLPLMSRDGGMLVAVPQDVLNDTVLLAAALNEDDGLLGPSREFQAEVVVENDEGAEVGTGDRQDFLVVDVGDDILASLREYDPVTDSLEEIVGFVSGKPDALVAVGDVMPDVANWLENITGEQGRLNFYSAREEQELVPAPKKKAQAKKVTTAMLAEQMKAMMAQIQVLASEQEALSKGVLKDPQSAVGVADHPLGAASAKLPALSAGVTPPQSGTVKKALSLVGPPPRTKLHAVGGDARCRRRTTANGNSFGCFRWRRSGDRGDFSTVGSSHKPGRSLDLRRCFGRPAGKFFFHLREHKRRCKTREDAAGPCWEEQSVLLASPATDLQEDVPSKVVPKDRGRVASIKRQHDGISGKVWGLQGPKGKWSRHVDAGSRYGCSGPGRFLCDQRVSGTALCIDGPSNPRRKLAPGLYCGAAGRTTFATLCREDAELSDAGAAFRPSGPTLVGGCEPIIREGDRPADFEEDRDKAQGPCREVRSRYTNCIPKKKTEISKASQGWGRQQRCMIDKPGGAMGPCMGSESSALHGSGCPEVSHPPVSNSPTNTQKPKSKKLGPHETSRRCRLSSGSAHRNAKVPCGRDKSDMQDLSSDPHASSSKVLDPILIIQTRFQMYLIQPNGVKLFVPGVMQCSLPLWCSMLTSQVLRSRSGFSSYLAKTIQLSRGRPSRGASAPTFFPIPIPVIGCFDRMPATLSNGRRHALHMSRTVSVICMALNYWHTGGRTTPDSLLLRGPNKQHRCLFERIRSLIKSDGLASGFSVPGAGRRFPELCARLSEISSMLTMQGVSNDPYDKSFSGIDLPKDNTVSPELSPYRDLDPARLVLHGTGSWDPCPYLGDELKMAFREPSSLLIDIPPGPHPKIRDEPSCVSALAKLWDEQGLLFLHQRPVMVEEQVRVFNAFKSLTNDRQIGDRRGRNSLESIVRGPSSSLPAGVDLQDICIDPRCQIIYVSITDRKDYYHQLKITESKALSNSIGPPVPIVDIVKTRAYQSFVERSRFRYRRDKQGDQFNHRHNDRLHVTPYHLPSDLVWVSFNSVLQGDHTGVEVATESHSALLESHGLLGDDVRLLANRPLRNSSQCQGLVIDDFFALSVERAGCDRTSSVAHETFQTAQEAYRQAKLLGSPAKDVDAETAGKLIGAYVNAKPETLGRGLCTVGAPPEKRIARPSSFASSRIRLTACICVSSEPGYPSFVTADR